MSAWAEKKEQNGGFGVWGVILMGFGVFNGIWGFFNGIWGFWGLRFSGFGVLEILGFLVFLRI